MFSSSNSKDYLLSLSNKNLAEAVSKTSNAVPKCNPHHFHSFYKTYIFDADGVLWLGAKAIPGAANLIKQLLNDNKEVIILTNNSTKSLSSYTEKFAKLNFTGLNQKNIVSAATVLTYELKKFITANPEKINLPIYLLGSEELKNYIECETGIKCIGWGPDTIDNYTQDTVLLDIDVTQKVSAVVASFDSHLSYVKVMKAVNYLKDKSVQFFVTNEDLTFPSSKTDVIVPGAGIISVILKAVSGREPIVMGKPHKPAFTFITEKFKIDTSKAIMIGDRCDTDISFGNQNKIETLLVLTGVHNLEDVENFRLKNSNSIPKMFIESVQQLIL